MHELEVAVPTADEALWELVRFWAGEIVRGKLEPYQGAQLIWWRGRDQLGRPEQLSGFVSLADDLEAHPEWRRIYEQEIVSEAQSLLDQM